VLAQCDDPVKHLGLLEVRDDAHAPPAFPEAGYETGVKLPLMGSWAAPAARRGTAFMANSSFKTDVAAIRDRARQKMSQGPVTESYGKDTKEVIAVLNEVLLGT
jgi:hypothetical protein